MQSWSRIVLLSTLFILFGCGRPGDESEPDKIKSSALSKPGRGDTTASVQDDAKTARLTQEEFALDPFGFKTTPEDFVRLFGDKLTVARRPVHNIHQPEFVDTVYELTTGSSRISIYRSAYNDILYEAAL